MTNQFNVGDLVKGVGRQGFFRKGEIVQIYNNGEYVRLKVLDYKDDLFIGEEPCMETKDFELHGD